MSTQMQEALDSLSRIANVLRECAAVEEGARPLPDAERIARKLASDFAWFKAGNEWITTVSQDFFIAFVARVLREEGVAE